MSQTTLLPLKPNTVYHLFSHAVDNNNLFYDNENYDYFLRKWEHFSKDYFQTYAFCLMPNHFHFCVQTLPQTQLVSNSETKKVSPHSKIMNNFLSGYTQALNKQRGRKGTLFRERFGRLEINDADYFKDAICYIHHNPIHHFNYEQYNEWGFSSYNSYVYSNEFNFLNTATALNRFGGHEGFVLAHENYKTLKKYKLIEEMVQQFYL